MLALCLLTKNNGAPLATGDRTESPVSGARLFMERLNAMTPPARIPDREEIVRNYLKFMQDAGFIYLQRDSRRSESSVTAHERAAALEEMRQRTACCTLCKLAGMGRTHVVFGEGNLTADLMIIGEAPGADEDRQGRPFVGRSGQLLNQMLEEAGIRREEVFIANIVKCRPPENRDPENDEIETCEPYLLAQIDLIQPRVIVSLGRIAARVLTADATGIMKLRGQWRLFHDVPLMPTIHPAALLRNMTHRDVVVQDLRHAVERIRETHR